MMTTSRAPFVLFLAAFATTTLTAMSSGQAPPDSSGSRVIRLPAEEAPPAQGPLERLDGHHLYWQDRDEATPTLSLGPAFPTRALTSVIERRVEQAGGRDAGISIEPLGSVLLVRGGAAGNPDAMKRAVTTAHGTVAEFHSITESLRFRTHVRLMADDDGDDEAPGDGTSSARVVIDETRVLASGERGAFGSRQERFVVGDFDVEVAASSSIVDPVIVVAESGETVHLWASTILDQGGQRRLHVQGLLDVATEVPTRNFDPDVYELGELEQPTIHTTQVMFASTIVPGEPLVVTLEGLRQTPSRRRLEIRAEALLAADAGDHAAAHGSRAVDLGRGMWRTGLAVPHSLVGEDLQVVLPEARMPASAAQLITLVFGRDRGPRPDLGSSIVVLPGEDAPRDLEIQRLFESVDPVGPPATLTVSVEDGLRASLPAVRGALLRVAHTEETLFVIDYDPQIASDAVLSDPRTEFSLGGSVFEGLLDWTPEGLRLEGFVHRRTVQIVSVRKADPIDVGRIQQRLVTTESTRVVAREGESVRGAGLDVTLSAR